MTAAYQALRENAAAIDLSARGKIRTTGADRVRLLHAMTTNHVEQLTPGHGCYAFFLDAQGHVLADVNLLAQPDALLLDAEPETREKIYAHLDHYIIADDVTLEDITAATATVAIEGPQAAQRLGSLGAPLPAEPLETAAWGDRTVVRASAAGGDGYWVLLPPAAKDAFLAELSLPLASADDVRTVRLENSHPRYGEDITEASLPQETQLEHALHFSKGCYLGQEIVERIHSRGHLSRLLVHLHVEGAEAPAPGTELTVEGKEAGHITSAAYSPALNCVVALGSVRAAHAAQGNRLLVGDRQAEVTGLRPH
jgi:folate-binding protein YgfZ